MPRRYAAKRDANEPEIISALEALGCSVQKLNCLDADLPDLLAGCWGMNFLIEVKDNKTKTTDGQLEFAHTWKGHTAFAHTPKQAIHIVVGGYLRKFGATHDVDRVTELVMQYLGKVHRPLEFALRVIDGNSEWEEL